DANTDHVAEHPVIGQRLRPERIDFERGRLHGVLLVGRVLQCALTSTERNEGCDERTGERDVATDFHRLLLLSASARARRPCQPVLHPCKRTSARVCPRAILPCTRSLSNRLQRCARRRTRRARGRRRQSCRVPAATADSGSTPSCSCRLPRRCTSV